MNYSVYSYVALAPLRSGDQPNPAAQQPEAAGQASDALKFAGTARISAGAPWYSRWWNRARIRPARAVERKVDFEVVLNLPPELRSQLGLGSEGAVIEIQLTRVSGSQKEES